MALLAIGKEAHPALSFLSLCVRVSEAKADRAPVPLRVYLFIHKSIPHFNCLSCKEKKQFQPAELFSPLFSMLLKAEICFGVQRLEPQPPLPLAATLLSNLKRA